jgi:UrcA family protein
MNQRLAVALIAASFVASAAAGEALAADPETAVTRTATITSAGLDLSTAGGAAALDRRILIAAEQVCRMDDRSMVNVTGDDFGSCVAHTVRHERVWASAQIARADAAEFARRSPVSNGARMADNSTPAR